MKMSARSSNHHIFLETAVRCGLGAALALGAACVTSRRDAPQQVAAAAAAARQSPQSTAAFRSAVVYEIYWRSFADGKPGAQSIMAKLPYFKNLGVTDLWITPFFVSPQKDGGYDIADYRKPDPAFGSLEDFDVLVGEAREQGLRIMVDMVLNHVSDQHPWFLDVLRQGKKSPYYAYFIWQPGHGADRPPDAQANLFDATPGSAWRWVPRVGEWVYHTFVKEQIDVDWKNPAVRAAMIDVVRFWAARGVGGFRFDVIEMIDKSPDKHALPGYLAELHDQVLAGHDFVTVGEMPAVTVDSLGLYTKGGGRGLNMAFNVEFPMLFSGNVPGNPFFGKYQVRTPRPAEIKDCFSRWQMAAATHGGWNALYLGTHDWARIVSRFVPEQADEAAKERTRQRVARLFAALLFTHQGTPFIYQGEELGLPSTVYASLKAYRDPESLGYYHTRLKQPGVTPAQALQETQQGSRDAARGPLPWEAGQPYSVAQQLFDPDSVLQFYRRLLALRAQNAAWTDGTYKRHDAGGDAPYVYSRQLPEGRSLVVVANLSAQPAPFEWPTSLPGRQQAKRLLSTEPTQHAAPTASVEAQLAPFEARLFWIGAAP